jgi:DNA mismatch repair ATPase MutS
MEGNAGSFFVEMREAAYILREASPRGLVLIDELVSCTCFHAYVTVVIFRFGV